VRYRTVVADPPWAYPSPAGNLRASESHRPNSWDTESVAGSRARYGAMSVEDIKALKPPVEDDAHLYIWATNAFICEAHDIARAWGFRPITVLTYVKTKPDGAPSMKSGYYFRGATEHIIFGVRGSLRTNQEKALPTAFLWPRKPHSVKPDEFYDLVEQASPGPYLELFARRARMGDWHYFGDQSLETAEVAA
jgi:N6-adenosine-specific RNA methylase IME4